MALLAALLLAIFVLPRNWGVVAVAVAGVIEVGESLVWWRMSRRARPAVGVETLVGRSAVVTESCRPVGQVRLDGELWRARCSEGAEAGETVWVQRIDGLTLEVVRVPGA